MQANYKNQGEEYQFFNSLCAASRVFLLCSKRTYSWHSSEYTKGIGLFTAIAIMVGSLGP